MFCAPWPTRDQPPGPLEFLLRSPAMQMVSGWAALGHPADVKASRYVPPSMHVLGVWSSPLLFSPRLAQVAQWVRSIAVPGFSGWPCGWSSGGPGGPGNSGQSPLTFSPPLPGRRRSYFQLNDSASCLIRFAHWLLCRSVGTSRWSSTSATCTGRVPPCCRLFRYDDTRSLSGSSSSKSALRAAMAWRSSSEQRSQFTPALYCSTARAQMDERCCSAHFSGRSRSGRWMQT